MSFHDIPSGPLTACQICGNPNLELVLDLGHQPLSDSLITKSELQGTPVSYPCRFVRCPVCTLGQIDYVVDGSIVYHPHYPYRTGVTKELTTYQAVLCEALLTELRIGDNALVVDIGSNDGTL